jgi:predicted phosphoadenosine phosphosulfate sulfurtransferase
MPLPPTAIREHSAFEKEMDIPEFARAKAEKNNCILMGIRTQESLRRLRMMTVKTNDNYIMRQEPYFNAAYPIYDWSSEDVWHLVLENKYDYNRTYDIFNRTRLFESLLAQRVCPPFGDEPLRGLWKYAECFPELWHKMLARVPGVNTAWRYANTELYSGTKKPEGLTWQEYVEMIVENWDDATVKESIRKIIKHAITVRHVKKTSMPVEDDRTHPLTGISWETLAIIAAKGDLKGRQTGALTHEATIECKRIGISIEEAQQWFGLQPVWEQRLPDAEERKAIERLRQAADQQSPMAASRRIAREQLQPKHRRAARA